MDKIGQGTSVLIESLDDLGRSILALEIKNPGISSAGIVKELGRPIDRKTVDHRRRQLAYQNALMELRRDNLLEVKAAQSRAIERLTELLEHPDASISLAAARILAEPSLKGATKKIEAAVEEERILRPVQNTVKVVFGDEGDFVPIIGETTMDDSGKIIPLSTNKEEKQDIEPVDEEQAAYIPDGQPVNIEN